MITPNELKEIREYTDKATPGPWGAHDGEGKYVSVYNGEVSRVVVFREGVLYSKDQNLKNAKFTARSRTDLPRLLNAYEALQAENKTLRNELCLKCERYKEAHLGRCNGCRWKQGV